MAGPAAAIAGLAAAAAAVLAAIYAAVPESVQRIAKEEFARIVMGDASEYEAEAIKSAFAKMGLDIDPAEGLTPQNITAAINAGPLAGTGIELTNIFDRNALRSDMEKIALAYAASAFGLEIRSMSVEGIKDAVRSEMSKRLMDQVSEGAGEWLELAPDLVDLAKQLDTAVRAGLIDGQGRFVPPELSMSEYHIDLRERQARYRARHTRHWEPR